MKQWLINHFNVQKGMYFDEKYDTDGIVFFGSNMISDSIWNYGIIDNITEETINGFISFCESIAKPANLYIPHISTFDDSILVDKGFIRPEEDGNLITETWMSFDKKKYSINSKCRIIRATTQRDMNDFVDVFLAAYGGGKTPDKPYGDLPPEYTRALTENFFDPKFYHFLCYSDDTPVSVASLCMYNSIGGLYNIGTKPEFERNGFGLAVTDACINQWESLSGTQLFLQTETGTGIDTWYNRIGFKNLFFGAIYEKC